MKGLIRLALLFHLGCIFSAFSAAVFVFFFSPKFHALHKTRPINACGDVRCSNHTTLAASVSTRRLRT